MRCVEVMEMSTENWAGAAIRDERYNYLYDDEALRGWVTPLIDLSKDVKEEYVYFNNHFQGAAAKNAGHREDHSETISEPTLFNDLLNATPTLNYSERAVPIPYRHRSIVGLD